MQYTAVSGCKRIVQAACFAVVCLLQHAVFIACTRVHHSCTVTVLWSTRVQALLWAFCMICSRRYTCRLMPMLWGAAAAAAAFEVQMHHLDLGQS
jgi:hypothetical protein